MASGAVNPEPWQELWAAARAARESGRTSAAMRLWTAVTDARHYSAEAYRESAEFVRELQCNLTGLARLYQKHRQAFGLAATDLTWRPPQFPSDKDGLSQVASLLRSACVIAPENAAWQYDLADFLERLGETEEAIEWREHIAKMFPEFHENEWALLNLLERTGDYSRARRYGESLIVRTPTAPEAILAQARIYHRLGDTEIGQLLCQRLRARVLAEDPNLPEHIDFLFRLAWTAARDGLPPGTEQLRTDLRHHCAALANHKFDDAKAHLANGYACLIDDDVDGAKASFSIGSWIITRNDAQGLDLSANNTYSRGFRFARAFVLDLAPDLTSRDEAPLLHGHDLAFPHCYWLWKNGGLIDAFENAPWLADASDVMLTRIYKGHHIALRNSAYFGIPVSEEHFTIIAGKAYRLTPILLILANLPGRIRKLMRDRASFEESDSNRRSHGPAWTTRLRAMLAHSRMKRAALALARFLLASQSISTALQAPNLPKLLAEIDRTRVTTDRIDRAGIE